MTTYARPYRMICLNCAGLMNRKFEHTLRLMACIFCQSTLYIRGRDEFTQLALERLNAPSGDYADDNASFSPRAGEMEIT